MTFFVFLGLELGLHHMTFSIHGLAILSNWLLSPVDIQKTIGHKGPNFNLISRIIRLYTAIPATRILLPFYFYIGYLFHSSFWEFMRTVFYLFTILNTYMLYQQNINNSSIDFCSRTTTELNMTSRLCKRLWKKNIPPR